MDKKHPNKFFNGFFWGAVLGGASAYVLSNKKGRQIVKELIAQGVEMLEDKAAPQKKVIDEAVNMIPDDDGITQEEVEANSLTDEKTDSKKRFFKKAVKK